MQKRRIFGVSIATTFALTAITPLTAFAVPGGGGGGGGGGAGGGSTDNGQAAAQAAAAAAAAAQAAAQAAATQAAQMQAIQLQAQQQQANQAAAAAFGAALKLQNTANPPALPQPFNPAFQPIQPILPTAPLNSNLGVPGVTPGITATDQTTTLYPASPNPTSADDTSWQDPGVMPNSEPGSIATGLPLTIPPGTKYDYTPTGTPLVLPLSSQYTSWLPQYNMVYDPSNDTWYDQTTGRATVKGGIPVGIDIDSQMDWGFLQQAYGDVVHITSDSANSNGAQWDPAELSTPYWLQTNNPISTGNDPINNPNKLNEVQAQVLAGTARNLQITSRNSISYEVLMNPQWVKSGSGSNNSSDMATNTTGNGATTSGGDASTNNQTTSPGNATGFSASAGGPTSTAGPTTISTAAAPANAASGGGGAGFGTGGPPDPSKFAIPLLGASPIPNTCMGSGKSTDFISSQAAADSRAAAISIMSKIPGMSQLVDPLHPFTLTDVVGGIPLAGQAFGTSGQLASAFLPPSTGFNTPIFVPGNLTTNCASTAASYLAGTPQTVTSDFALNGFANGRLSDNWLEAQHVQTVNPITMTTDASGNGVPMIDASKLPDTTVIVFSNGDDKANHVMTMVKTPDGIGILEQPAGGLATALSGQNSPYQLISPADEAAWHFTDPKGQPIGWAEAMKYLTFYTAAAK